MILRIVIVERESRLNRVYRSHAWESYSLRVFYPNIHAILLLLLCLPIGTCLYEQSFSALRRLHGVLAQCLTKG